MVDGPGRSKRREQAGAGFAVLRQAASFFLEDRAKRLSAGLAYYTLFALVPSLLLSVAIAAAFVGKEAAAGELQDQIASVLGADASKQIEQAIAAMWESGERSNFAVFSLVFIVFSASVLFVAWRDMIELIWDVPYEPSLQTTLRTRAFAVLVPIGAGLLLAATMLLQGLVTFVQELVRLEVIDVALRTASAIGQVVIGVVALGVLYRHSARGVGPTWRDVFPASIFVVAVLGVGFWAYGLYLRFVGVASVTGAASSVVLGLVVIYYTAQTLLFGAEVIKALDHRRADS